MSSWSHVCITQQLRRLWGVSMPCTSWARQWWRLQPRRQRSSKAIFSKKIRWTFISIASIALKIKMFRIFINLQSWCVDVRLVFFHHHVSVSLSYTVQCYNILQAKKIFRKGARDARKLGLTKQALAFMQDLGHLAGLRLWSHDVTKFLVVTWWSLENTLLLVPGKWFSNFPLWSLWHTLTNILQSSSIWDLRPSVAGPGWIVGSGGTLQTSATRWSVWVVFFKHVKPCEPWCPCLWKCCARPWWVVGQFSSGDP